MSYWKHKNMTIFSYGKEGSASPVKGDDVERQAPTDWSRQIEAGRDYKKKGGADCVYYINGIKLSELRKDKPFGDVKKLAAGNKEALKLANEELRNFFKEQLFPNYPEKEQMLLVESAVRHLHQAGIPHATNFSISAQKTRVKVKEPVMRIDFNTTAKGLEITETNIYKKITDQNGKPIDEIPAKSEKFQAKTITKSLFTTGGPKLQDLEIDCPNRSVADIFDKRKLWEKISQYISNMIDDLRKSPTATLGGPN